MFSCVSPRRRMALSSSHYCMDHNYTVVSGNTGHQRPTKPRLLIRKATAPSSFSPVVAHSKCLDTNGDGVSGRCHSDCTTLARDVGSVVKRPSQVAYAQTFRHKRMQSAPPATTGILPQSSPLSPASLHIHQNQCQENITSPCKARVKRASTVSVVAPRQPSMQQNHQPRWGNAPFINSNTMAENILQARRIPHRRPGLPYTTGCDTRGPPQQYGWRASWDII